MTASELIDGEPNYFLIHGRVYFLAERASNLNGGRAPVTALPDKRGGLVKAVGAVTVEIL